MTIDRTDYVMPLRREPKPSLQQRQRPFKLPPMSPISRFGQERCDFRFNLRSDQGRIGRAQADLAAATAQEQVARDEGGYSQLVADADASLWRLWPSLDK